MIANIDSPQTITAVTESAASWCYFLCPLRQSLVHAETFSIICHQALEHSNAVVGMTTATLV